MAGNLRNTSLKVLPAQSLTMKKTQYRTLALIILFYVAGVSAASDPPLNGEKQFAFGLQAAPLTFGLSLKYAFSETWSIQGVISPWDGDPFITLRGFKRIQQAQYWKSYAFAGFATGNEDYGNDQYDRSETAYTIGMGIEWSWQARNILRPPLFTSIELGLGYRNDESIEVNGFGSSESNAFLALGVGLHYHF